MAVVGLGFGAEFPPIWEAHPGANATAICQRNEKSLHEVGDRFGIDLEHRPGGPLLGCGQARPRIKYTPEKALALWSAGHLWTSLHSS